MIEFMDTERPEVKFTLQFKSKEKLENKMIEFIDVTTKHTAVEMPESPVPPHPPKDHMTTQLDAIGQALKRSLDKHQQLQCENMYEVIVLYRHVTQAH